MTAPSKKISTWRERIGQAANFPLHMPTDVERAMVAEIADLRAALLITAARMPYVACAYDDSDTACSSCNLTMRQARQLAAMILERVGTIRYTCIGNGGAYEVIGEARGAGTLKSSGRVRVYRDAVTGGLFYRTLRDFDDRMCLAENVAEEAES
jgi:hypothetical protein